MLKYLFVLLNLLSTSAYCQKIDFNNTSLIDAFNRIVNSIKIPVGADNLVKNSMKIPVGADNLVKNPSFIDGATGWGAYTGTWKLISKWKPILDKNLVFCAQVSNGASDPQIINQNLPSLSANHSYLVEALVKVDQVTSSDPYSGATIGLEWSRSDGKYLGGYFFPRVTGSVSEWKKLSGIVTVQNGAKNVGFVLKMDGNSNGTAKFRDISITEWQSSANVVRNPSFEDTNTIDSNWQLSNGQWSIDTQHSDSGKNSVLLNIPQSTDRSYMLRQFIPAAAGRRYQLEATVMTTNVQGDYGASISLEWFDSNGNYLGGHYPSAVSGTHDWQRISQITPLVPSSVGNISVSSVVVTLSYKGKQQSSSGAVWFDDVVVRSVDNLVNNADFEKCQYTNNVSAKNYINCGDVWQPMSDDWKPIVAWQPDFNYSYSGHYSAKLSSPSTPNTPHRIYQKNITVTPNQKYLVKAWVQTQGLSNGTAGIGLEGSSGRWSDYVDGMTGDSGWQLVSKVMTPTSSPVNLVLFIQGGAKGTAWIDDISVRPITSEIDPTLQIGVWGGPDDFNSILKSQTDSFKALFISAIRSDGLMSYNMHNADKTLADTLTYNFGDKIGFAVLSRKLVSMASHHYVKNLDKSQCETDIPISKDPPYNSLILSSFWEKDWYKAKFKDRTKCPTLFGSDGSISDDLLDTVSKNALILLKDEIDYAKASNAKVVYIDDALSASFWSRIKDKNGNIISDLKDCTGLEKYTLNSDPDSNEGRLTNSTLSLVSGIDKSYLGKSICYANYINEGLINDLAAYAHANGLLIATAEPEVLASSDYFLSWHKNVDIIMPYNYFEDSTGFESFLSYVDQQYSKGMGMKSIVPFIAYEEYLYDRGPIMDQTRSEFFKKSITDHTRYYSSDKTSKTPMLIVYADNPDLPLNQHRSRMGKLIDLNYRLVEEGVLPSKDTPSCSRFDDKSFPLKNVTWLQNDGNSCTDNHWVSTNDSKCSLEHYQGTTDSLIPTLPLNSEQGFKNSQSKFRIIARGSCLIPNTDRAVFNSGNPGEYFGRGYNAIFNCNGSSGSVNPGATYNLIQYLSCTKY